MIQTEPDYGEPKFYYSSEKIGDWSVTIQIATDERWIWEADRIDGAVVWKLNSRGEGLESYEAAKLHCISVLESLTPDGFIPQSYISTEDASNKVRRLENGRWLCVRGSAPGIHDFATASLAAAAHEVESYEDIKQEEDTVTLGDALARITAGLDGLSAEKSTDRSES